MAYKIAMWGSRGIRLCYALPSDAMLAALSSAAAFLAVAATLVVPKMESHPRVLLFILAMLAIAGASIIFVIVMLVIRMCFEFQRRTYDVTTILPLVTRFESEPMEAKFTLAAQRTLEILSIGWRTVDHVMDVDPALDFLEDIGLLLAKNQTSDELAHHYFYPYIQSYYVSLRSYIKDVQQRPGEKAAWQYIEPLFERTFLIERKIDSAAEKYPPKQKLIQFLETEAENPPEA